MPLVERVAVSREEFEQRQWENLRSSAVPQQRAAQAKPSKASAAKQPAKSDSKPAKKGPKASPVKAAPPPVDAATAAANSARMAALLEIICPEDTPAAAQATCKSGATPPWRRQ